MYNKKLRVLILGSAFSADLHLDGYSRLGGKVEVAAIAGRDQNRVAALAERYGVRGYSEYADFEQAIDEVDCDLVDICLPNFLHHAAAIRALKRRRHIICEKPLATTVEDAADIVRTAAEAGKRVYYAEDWMCAPALVKARELIAQGGIGAPVFTRMRECHNGSHSPYAQTIEYCGGGCMIHMGIHPVGFLLAMKNNEWTELVALTSGGREDNLIHRGLEGEDWAGAMMRFRDGAAAIVESNYVSEGGMEDVVDFYGTQGCLHVDLTQSGALRGYSVPGFEYTVEKAGVTTGWSRPAVDERQSLGYAAEIAHFVECALDNTDARVGLRGADGLEALKVVHYIYQSAREGIKITNPKFTAK